MGDRLGTEYVKVVEVRRLYVKIVQHCADQSMVPQLMTIRRKLLLKQFDITFMITCTCLCIHDEFVGELVMGNVQRIRQRKEFVYVPMDSNSIDVVQRTGVLKDLAGPFRHQGSLIVQYH